MVAPKGAAVDTPVTVTARVAVAVTVPFAVTPTGEDPKSNDFMSNGEVVGLPKPIRLPSFPSAWKKTLGP